MRREARPRRSTSSSPRPGPRRITGAVCHLGPQWQIELLMTIGFYMMVSRLLENLEVELEETNVEHLEVPRG
jgi:hypothetical protein